MVGKLFACDIDGLEPLELLTLCPIADIDGEFVVKKLIPSVLRKCVECLRLLDAKSPAQEKSPLRKVQIDSVRC